MSSQKVTSQLVLSRACVSCGRSDVPVGKHYSMCEPCWHEPFTRDPVLQELRRALPIDPHICPHPPGSADKIEWMQMRVAMGFACCNPLDPTFEGYRPGCVQPNDLTAEVLALPRLRVRGVEPKDGRFRARPYYEGARHDLGIYRTEAEAAAVVRRFWIQRLGIFWELGGTMWHYRGPSSLGKLARHRHIVARRGRPHGPALPFEEEGKPKFKLRLWQKAG